MSPVSRRLVEVYGVLVAVALALSPGAVALHHLWMDFDNLGYTHGYVILALSLWLIFRERQALAALPRRFSIDVLPPLAVSLAAWLVCWWADIRDGYLVLSIAIVWLTAYMALGRAIALKLAFPIGYLYFALPAWSWISWPLQQLTLIAVRVLLPLSGVPVHIAGPVVYIPAGAFQVAPECAGVHFLIVGLALAALLGELNRDSPRQRLALVVFLGGIALVSNWLRVSAIIAIGQYTHMQHPLVRDHYRFGWIVFTGALVAAFWALSRSPATVASKERAI